MARRSHRQSVAVIAFGDTALLEAGPQLPSASIVPQIPTIAPCDSDVDTLAEFLNAGERVTLCGAGCAGRMTK